MLRRWSHPPMFSWDGKPPTGVVLPGSSPDIRGEHGGVIGVEQVLMFKNPTTRAAAGRRGGAPRPRKSGPNTRKIIRGLSPNTAI